MTRLSAWMLICGKYKVVLMSEPKTLFETKNYITTMDLCTVLYRARVMNLFDTPSSLVDELLFRYYKLTKRN